MSGRNAGNGSEVVAKICKVCDGKATGFHFGVMSCEGCKGFFRRNVKKNARFICNYDKNCDVKGEKRKNCQACRMARCESSGMRRDRIMMTERRKNRRTEEKKARLAAEAAAKSAAEAAAAATTVPNIKHEIPDPTTPTTTTALTSNVPKPTVTLQTIVKKEIPEPDVTTSHISLSTIEDIKQERDQSPPIENISNPTTDSSQNSTNFQNDSELTTGIKQETFHPAQFRPEQTTMQCLPQQKDFQHPLQIDQFQFNNSLNQHQINQTAFNYQHMINQYMPGYQPPTSPTNPIEDIMVNDPRNTRNPNQSDPKPEPSNPIWNKFWNSVSKNDSIGSPSSPNSNPTALPATSPKTVPTRTNSTNEPWNNNLEMPIASGVRARHESSLGSPSSPTSVSRNSLSGSSSIDDILLARKKTINTEMTHIKEARHASFISRHIREKRQMDELDRNNINRMLPYSILDVERNYANTSDWLDNCEDPTSDTTAVNPINHHQPLTTPNGSIVGSEKKGTSSDHSNKMDSQSGEDSFATDRRKHEKYTEFFADLMECGVKEIVSYCKLIPEFYSLAMADQEYLLRSTILELLILKCYFNYKDGEFLNGVNGIWLRREDFIIATKDVSFIDNLMQLMQKMAALEMTEEDVLLLMLVTLFNHDSPGSLAQNREQISISKKYFVSKMMDHMNKSENNIHMKDRGTECLLLLPLLSTLNNSFMDILAGLSIQHSRTVDLGPISTLIYELKPELKDKDTRSLYLGSRIPHWPYSNGTSSSNLQKTT